MSKQNDTTYIADVETWRAQREAELRAPDSWLSLTGLYILTEGRHTIGSSPNNDIVLPHSAPEYIGVIEFRHNRANLIVTTDASLLVDGIMVREATLTDNSNRRQPTLVTTGTVTFFVHHFGDQYAIRIKDRRNPAITAFGGRQWFAVKPEYRVQGHFAPHAAPQSIPIKTIVDTNSHYQSVGAITFELQGQTLRLLATDHGVPGQLWVSLRDGTSGQTTYGPARFLAVDVAADGSAVVDFNKAVNPPCAFSPFATCPLPPRENILPVAIEAGERYSATPTPVHAQQAELQPA